LGLGIDAAPDSLSGRLQRAKGVVMGSLLAKQCHAGGYAHAYRTAALKKAGGYDKTLWPYVLKDHELMHRVMKLGRARYDFDLWCQPSPRRADRTAVRWTLSERILYHVTPYVLKDWFFYSFLSRRLRARNMDEISLRQRTWDEAP
ncbi:MAG: glycosyltransferase family 2 protein, partial [Pseudomonadota bacterium]